MACDATVSSIHCVCESEVSARKRILARGSNRIFCSSRHEEKARLASTSIPGLRVNCVSALGKRASVFDPTYCNNHIPHMHDSHTK